MVIASVVLTPTFASTREARALSFGSIRAVKNADLLMGGDPNVVEILFGVTSGGRERREPLIETSHPSNSSIMMRTPLVGRLGLG